MIRVRQYIPAFVDHDDPLAVDIVESPEKALELPYLSRLRDIDGFQGFEPFDVHPGFIRGIWSGGRFVHATYHDVDNPCDE